MTDRYDEGMEALRETPVPEQWDEITRRIRRTRPAPAAEMSPDLGGPGPNGRRRRWPLILTTAASLALLVGVVALFTRDDPDVTTADPSMTTHETSGTSETSQTTSSTTTSPPTGALPNEVVDIDSYPVSACRGVRLRAADPPQGIGGVMEDVAFDDPRVPEIVHGNLTGVFAGDTTTRAVFVVAGWPGLNDEAGGYVEGPFPGVLSYLSPYGDGWFAELAVPASLDTPDTYCPFTLVGLGLNDADLRQFVAGLALEG